MKPWQLCFHVIRPRHQFQVSCWFWSYLGLDALMKNETLFVVSNWILVVVLFPLLLSLTACCTFLNEGLVSRWRTGRTITVFLLLSVSHLHLLYWFFWWLCFTSCLNRFRGQSLIYTLNLNDPDSSVLMLNSSQFTYLAQHSIIIIYDLTLSLTWI